MKFFQWKDAGRKNSKANRDSWVQKEYGEHVPVLLESILWFTGGKSRKFVSGDCVTHIFGLCVDHMKIIRASSETKREIWGSHSGVTADSSKVPRASIFRQKKSKNMKITEIWYFEKSANFHYINKIQQDSIVYRYLFTAKSLYMFRVSIAPIIRST